MRRLTLRSRNVRRAHLTKAVALVSGLVLCGAAVVLAAEAPQSSNLPTYTPDGALNPPARYRTWIYLSSGLGMSYSDAPAGTLLFDNVFVNPEAFAVFERTGTWPDKTMLVLELRGATQNGSINRGGHFQSDVHGIEVHVKDAARFDGGWAFFSFSSGAPAAMIPRTAACYSCHEQHAAVDTTFVQFYPTLLPIARAQKTLSPAFLAAETAPAN